MDQRKKTSGWNFQNTYIQLPEVFFERVNPTPVQNPTLIKFNLRLATELGLDASALKNEPALFSGNQLPTGSEPIALAYAGHQFGYFNRLGDGRATLLGEQITPNGERFDIQLKGSGPTRFARRGDGRAALGPMLREYIISEAMSALGIPTTRSLAVVSTGELVQRADVGPGGILTRVASSHLRVGTFEFAASLGDLSQLKALTDYAIKRHDPDLFSADEPYLAFLTAVMKRQAKLVASWMHVGFIHGVLNTDNVSISGETIDYGPCAFMDTYAPDTVFSSIDTQGRYAYQRQPDITRWNITRLAEALLPLFDTNEAKSIEKAEAVINQFSEAFLESWLAGMKAKFGFHSHQTLDRTVIESLVHWMENNEADWTQTFRDLSRDKLPENQIYASEEFKNWAAQWRALKPDLELMRKTNPAVIARNYRVEEAITEAVENQNTQPLDRLLALLEKPFEESQDGADFLAPPKTRDLNYQTFCGT